MAQNFVVFADRSATVKIRTANFFRSLPSTYYGLAVGVVLSEPRCEIKNHKISSEGLAQGGDSTKFCTSENLLILTTNFR